MGGRGLVMSNSGASARAAVRATTTTTAATAATATATATDLPKLPLAAASHFFIARLSSSTTSVTRELTWAAAEPASSLGASA